MTTVADVDRLVQEDDSVAARLWPHLGPRVRDAYLRDRDAWISLRREVEKGTPPRDDVLNARRSAFAGWGRAFGVAARKSDAGRRSPRAQQRSVPAARALATSPSSPTAVPAAVSQARPAVPPLAHSSASAPLTAALVAGLAVSGLVMFAARRNRP